MTGIPSNRHGKPIKVYISIPITGMVKESGQKAATIKKELEELGYIAVSPYEINAGLKPTYADYIGFDLRELLKCNAVLFCLGWEKSCGCNIEHDAVMRMIQFKKKHFDVYYEKENEDLINTLI